MALYEIDNSGRVWRIQQRQVGWRGQTGRLYTMDENPAATEPGSFSPMYITVEADRVEVPDPEEMTADG